MVAKFLQILSNDDSSCSKGVNDLSIQKQLQNNTRLISQNTGVYCLALRVQLIVDTTVSMPDTTKVRL